ncbi:MAG: PEP-CTERM sorting domain-containing protein [Deltaproteobacteria bacterium]|nr:MAG: PEP-CTERM sorting domain-containing protein [Deltaproteobacteria bacterium]
MRSAAACAPRTASGSRSPRNGVQLSPVPEPSSFGLLTLGVAQLAARRRHAG